MISNFGTNNNLKEKESIAKRFAFRGAFSLKCFRKTKPKLNDNLTTNFTTKVNRIKLQSTKSNVADVILN